VRRALALDVARLAVAALAIVALTHQLDSLGGAKAGNFFSFFTVQSNIAAVAMQRCSSSSGGPSAPCGSRRSVAASCSSSR
jgi:hypothetical protein